MVDLLRTAAPTPDASWFRTLNLATSDPVLDGIMFLATLLGTSYVIALVAVPLWWRGHKDLAVDVLVVLLVTILATDVLKLLTDRPRPCEVLADARTLAYYPCGAESGPAFPSGHTSRAFALAAFLGLRLSGRVGIAAGGFAAIVGLSRIYLGVHWPTDVLAGAFLGVAIAVVAWAAIRRAPRYARLREGIVSSVDRAIGRVRRD